MAPVYRWRRRYYRGGRRPRTFRNRRRRYRSWRPRGVSWRRLYRRRFRRRRARRRPRSIVKQWQPRYRTKCIIRGYMPLMFVYNVYDGVKDFVMPQGGLKATWTGGGVESTSITLLDLYWEERFWRAKWSRSNQGYNLMRYFGCELKLYPLQYYSYIFWWSTEDLEPDHTPLTVCHPSQLILSKNYRIVKHWSGRGRIKPTVIRIKPPATMLNTWLSFTEAAKLPLLKWRCAFIDLEQIWTAFPTTHGGQHTAGVEVTFWSQKNRTSEAKNWNLTYFPWLDEGGNLQVCYKDLTWSQAGGGPDTSQANFWPIDAEYETLLVPFYIYVYGWPAAWYSNLKTVHEPKPQDQTKGRFLFVKYNNSRAWISTENNEADMPAHSLVSFSEANYIAAAGPFVEKGFPAGGVNATMSFKFYFQWGGTPGQRLPPSQPAAGQPQPWPTASLRWPGTLRADIRNPLTCGDEVLEEEDYDANGIIKPRALRHLIKASLSTEKPENRFQKSRIWGASPERFRKRRREPSTSGSESAGSAEEETTEHSSSEEEEEDPETTARLRHRRRKRKRMERLVRSVLDRVILTSGSMSPSGRPKSHSI
ncbi:MAG: ORF1 [Anelloviridae sp.]|nr:MAG: ORF1 [Anelloviridae sp.]